MANPAARQIRAAVQFWNTLPKSSPWPRSVDDHIAKPSSPLLRTVEFTTRELRVPFAKLMPSAIVLRNRMSWNRRLLPPVIQPPPTQRWAETRGLLVLVIMFPPKARPVPSTRVSYDPNMAKSWKVHPLPPTWKPQETFLVPPAVTSLVCHMPAP